VTTQLYARSDTLHKAVMLTVVIVPFLVTVEEVYRLWNQWVAWQDLVIFAIMYGPTGVGVTVGYHRMATHNGFQVKP